MIPKNKAKISYIIVSKMNKLLTQFNILRDNSRFSNNIDVRILKDERLLTDF